LEHLADPAGVAEDHRGAEVVPSDLRGAGQHLHRPPRPVPDAGFQERLHRLGKIAATGVHFGF
jgi:hypothetical protein